MAELSSSNSSGGRRDEDGDGGDALDRDRDGEVWCIQDGRVYEQREQWEFDSCTSCSCQVSVEQNLRQQPEIWQRGVCW